MGLIKTQDARGLFTKELTAIYKEKIRPTAFLRSFYTEKVSGSKEISIEVQRGKEKVAVDVERGSIGNRNASSKSTEKIFVPPYFREYFDMTDLDHYKLAFNDAAQGMSPIIFGQLLAEAADKMSDLIDMIERAVELQASQVLQTGIVTLKSGGYIDFKRKAASLVDLGTAAYWADSGVDPTVSIEAGCNFIRTVGKSGDGTFNMILGSEALTDLLNNTILQSRNDIKQYSLDVISGPQRNAEGAAYHGQLSAGSYRVNIWTYPQFYDNASGVSTPYIGAKNAIILPTMPKFVLNYAAVPQLLKGTGTVTKGKYLFGEYTDERQAAHVMDVKSAPLCVPVGIDQIYTMQVVED